MSQKQSTLLKTSSSVNMETPSSAFQWYLPLLDDLTIYRDERGFDDPCNQRVLRQAIMLLIAPFSEHRLSLIARSLNMGSVLWSGFTAPRRLRRYWSLLRPRI
jgi:hypothetical protein